METNSEVIEWLLQGDEPSLKWRTLRELLDFDEDASEVKQAKAAIPQSAPVLALLGKMHPDGYWLQKNPRTKVYVGDDVLYGNFATTHFCLAYLAELGMDRSHPLMEKAAERYLSLQKTDGDWLNHYSCLFGYNIRTYVLLGYREDARVKKSIELLLQTVREDGGYLCDWHEGKYKTRQVKSCIRGAVKCLLAFAELPEYWDHPRCRQLVEYFLNRGGIYRSKNHDIFVNDDMKRHAFPIIWRANLWEILYALSKMGYGNDERLISAWNELESRADDTGRYKLDWTPAECPWKVGERSEVNKWITFYVLLAEKYRASIMTQQVL
ncbi:MAG: hypothetical protein A2Y88_15325 [Chloroflexi bacterium RBG_13_48_10]|nr:MAG: hypothetical protein A2Y88_15325 [Chloroflexi bacterium RBG_13_48_10]